MKMALKSALSSRSLIATMSALAGVALLSACSAKTASPPTSGTTAQTVLGASATPIKTVGFIMVGSRNDYGYNQAVYAASQTVTSQFPGIKVLTADKIPENTSVTQTMQSMVDAGAGVIFASSYGYFPYALAFAKSHPKVIVVHQGGFLDGVFPPNFGTYWGEAFEPVSLGGIAAGSVTKTNKLGFVYAFPISQTIDNINGFELGALSVNPNARTYLVNTSNWCDPLKQKEAASALISEGADVLTQHQDCQATVIQAAKAAHVHAVGYHFDARSLDPNGWLTGSAWNWTPVFDSIIKTSESGHFTSSAYNANWIGTFATHNNPLQLASFGTSVSPSVQAKIRAEATALQQPGASVFKGPIYCQDGTLLVRPGVTPTYAQINGFSCLVRGVVGTLAKK